MADKYVPQDRVPLPPKGAKTYTTACDYCIVGCGYRVFTWPVGEEGGYAAGENALSVDLPTRPFEGWVSPNQHNVALIGGRPHHVVVQPDPDAEVVNRGGNHSIRGGTLALKVYNPNGPTSDRLKTPLLRVNGEQTPIPWDDAFDIMARMSRHVLDTHGEAAWGMKTYSYEYFENTYAMSKMAFRSIGTPAYSPHDKPGPGNDTAGLDDSGIIPFSASFEDWSIADTILISGTDPFETKSIVFTEWMMSGNRDKRLIMALPRKTAGVARRTAASSFKLSPTPTLCSIWRSRGSSWRTGGRTRSLLTGGSRTTGRSTPAWDAAPATRPGSGGQPGAGSEPTSKATASGCSSSHMPSLPEPRRSRECRPTRYGWPRR